MQQIQSNIHFFIYHKIVVKILQCLLSCHKQCLAACFDYSTCNTRGMSSGQFACFRNVAVLSQWGLYTLLITCNLYVRHVCIIAILRHPCMA